MFDNSPPIRSGLLAFNHIPFNNIQSENTERNLSSNSDDNSDPDTRRPCKKSKKK